jgi:hypothetical protein
MLPFSLHTRILAAATAVSILSTLLMVAAMRMQSAKTEALKTELASTKTALEASEAVQKRAAAASAHRGKLRATTAKKTATEAVAVAEALAKHPEWRDTPVPQEVQDALK